MMPEARVKASKGTGLKILSPKQMLQRLPIALAQVEAGKISESLLNEIRQIVYSLYQSKQITKKSIQYHNQINFIAYKRWTLYLWTQRTVKHLSLTNELDLRIGEKVIALSNLITHGET